jgi:hypothetical protein
MSDVHQAAPSTDNAPAIVSSTKLTPSGNIFIGDTVSVEGHAKGQEGRLAMVRTNTYTKNSRLFGSL